MPRTIEQQIETLVLCLNGMYEEYGTKSNVSDRRATAMLRGDTAQVRIISNAYNRIHYNERKSDELRSSLEQQQVESINDEEHVDENNQ